LIVPRKITNDMATLAELRNKQMDTIPYQSIRNGDGHHIGCYGEVLIENYLGARKEEVDIYNFDCIWNDLRIEVKTVECSSPPLPHYMCSVASANTKQKCDYYAFTRMLCTLTHGYVMGFVERDNFYKICKHYPAYTVDDSNGHVVKHPCYKVRASQCMSLEELCKEVF
jgi:hypothetical protein